MIKEKNPLLKLKLTKKKSVINEFYNSIIESIYTLYNLILEDPIENFWFECIHIFFGYMPIICYIWDTTFFPIWNQDYLIKEIFSNLRYVYLTPFLRTNQTIYFIFMKIIPILIFILVIFIVILLYQIKNNKFNFMWPIIFLRICLPIVSNGFFGQIFLFLTTLFDCQNGHTYISEELKCRTGDWFVSHSPIVAIAMVLHFILALITNTLYYKSLFIRSKSDVLKKTNSIPDISLLCTKFIIILLFVLDKQEESEHWVIVILLMILTGFNAYINLYYKNRLNLLLMLLNIIFSLILFFGFFTLFIGKIFKFLGYNGSIFFYFLIIVIIFIFIIFYKSRETDFALIDYKSINNADEYINYILKYYRIILNKNNSRNNLTLLKSYIETIEDTCIDNNCSLKLYLEKLKSGVDSQYLLYDYLDKLFRYGVSKFKNNVMLKNDYAMFLLVKMNNKNQAIIVLNNIKDEYISFHRKYNIFRCKNLINKWASPTNNFYFNHRKNINKFRKLISETINLYHEFWTLLYESTFSQKNNFNNLYKYGTKVMKLNVSLEELYNLLIKTKTNNISVFKLYSEYIEIILKNNEKYLKYKNINTSIYSESVENESKKYANFNLDILKLNDNKAFLLLSGRKKDLGSIIDCSISASTVFGYTKEELIGKHMNLFIPDIFHPKHNIIVNKYSKIFNIDLFEQQFQNKEYSPIFTEGTFFGVLKSKFIKPLNLKIYYIKTEDNLISFIVEISRDIQYMEDLFNNKLINSNIETRCCILTNEDFLIHGFTVNSIEQLGINYRYTKSNNSIIPYIKQLCNDYRNMINDLNLNNNNHMNNNKELIQIDSSFTEFETDSIKNISPENKRKIKDELINKKYKDKCQITWRINKKIEKKIKIDENNNDNDNDKSNKCTRISYRGSSYNLPINKNDENQFEFEFIMEIKKAILDNKLLGYYFYFSKLYPSKTKNFICYNISEKNDKNGDLIKITKYKTIFKSSQKIFNDNNKTKLSSQIIVNHNKDKNINDKNKKDEISNSDISNKNKSNIVKFLGNDADTYNNSEDEIIIDERFIPKCKINFSFDLNNYCYNCDKDYNDSKILNDALYKEAKKKIDQYQKFLKTLNNKEKESDINNSESEGNDTSESEEDSDSDDLEEEEISKEISNDNSLIKSNSINKKNINIYRKSITVRNMIKSRIEKINSIKGSKTLKVIKEVKNEEKTSNNNKNESQIKINNNISDKLKKYQGKNFINDYYKVNLSSIRLMIYDFNKDMLIEGNKNEINFKIENIIINSKKQNEIINIGKDEKYPFISFKVNKNEKNNKNKKIENNNIISTINQNKINEENILSRKINDAINNERNEDEVNLLCIYALISFIIMIIFGLLFIIICFRFYNRIKEIIKIVKNIVDIKYCNTFSIYCLRELTLLNFNFTITGGVYNKFPGKDREKYKSLIKSKFEDYFLETQSNIMKILSSTFSPSKNTDRNLTETLFFSQYFLGFKMGFIEADLLTTLVQYNAAFYNLATTYKPIYQSHSDMFNFMHNSFNNYTRILDFLLNQYDEELKVENKNILFFFISFTILVLILYIIICIIIIKSFIAIAQIRINYLKVFYGINSNSIKNLMIDCEKIMNKIKIIESNHNEEESEEEFEEKKSIVHNKNKYETGQRNMALTNYNSKNNKTIMPLSSKIFLFFFIIFMIGEYLYFPINCLLLLNLSNKSFDYYNFFNNYNTFHSNILNIFNIYREYLFDNKTKIHEETPFDILQEIEINFYNSTWDLLTYSNNFINQNIKINDEMINVFSKDFCSYYMTDYFDSNEECKSKYSYIIGYDFSIFATNFLQNIRYLKNIAKYTFETENIVGELAVEEDQDLERIKELEQSGQKFIFKLDLFNNETLHMEMNSIYINILLPYIDSLRKVLLNSISIGGKELLFILLFCLYLFLIFLICFAYLLPMIRYLNNSIYKTKKILLLIPMKILASQINIKSLLKLN